MRSDSSKPVGYSSSFISLCFILATVATPVLLFVNYNCRVVPEAPTSAEAALEPEPSGTVGVTQTVTLQPSFSNEDGVNASRIELRNTLDSGQTIRLLVKGDPPIPGGGFISIGMDMEPGIELVFREPEDRVKIYRGNGWSTSYWLPADKEQHVIMLVENTGDKEAIACFRLAYEHPPEPEPDPEFKSGNDPPLPEVSTPTPTPKAL